MGSLAGWNPRARALFCASAEASRPGRALAARIVSGHGARERSGAAVLDGFDRLKKGQSNGDFEPRLQSGDAQDLPVRADAEGMFRRLADPLPLSEASLLVFRPAMNAPVLNVGYLPVGPVRAAAVAFAEEYGGIGIALGLRAVESGQLAVLRNQESIDFEVPLEEALEPLLAEAERMGFLFDEDIFESDGRADGRARAMALWAQLMGTMDGLIPPPEPRRESRRADEDDASGPLSPSLAMEEMQYPEMMLDEVAPFTLDDADLASERTETLEPDSPILPPARAPEPKPTLAPPAASRPSSRPPEPEPEDELLEAGLDDLLVDSLDEPAGGDEILAESPFGEDDVDWERRDPILAESDLTQPTDPIPGRRADPALPATAAVAACSNAPTPPLQAERPERVAAPRVVAPPARVSPAAPPPSEPLALKSTTGEPQAVALPANPPPPAEPAPSGVVPDSPAPPSPRPAPAAVLPRTLLSKFRQADGVVASPEAGGRGASSEVGADRSSELARIPIVRVKRQRDGAKRVPLLARLLSSF